MGLNPMDQAPRAAFIAAVVKPDERTAVMGITSTLRTLAMAVGPSVTSSRPFDAQRAANPLPDRAISHLSSTIRSSRPSRPI